jgi:hypothetical protein
MADLLIDSQVVFDPMFAGAGVEEEDLQLDL